MSALASAVRDLIGRIKAEPKVVRLHVIDYSGERRSRDDARHRGYWVAMWRHCRTVAIETCRYCRIVAVGYFVAMGAIGTVSALGVVSVAAGVLLALSLGLWSTLNKDFAWLAERLRGVAQ